MPRLLAKPNKSISFFRDGLFGSHLVQLSGSRAHLLRVSDGQSG
jgi:hypothetical protein